mmetsp:Transcript_9388/g.13892  ORF Transcript_9388/g.13892 Transcript_9388/m.13892 type:complete len:256 (-) Transcript_9388:23-790(-)
MGNTINKFVFFPPETTYTEEHPYPVTWIKTKSNKNIPAYHLISSNKDNKKTILYSHGNAADIGAMFPFLHLLHQNLDVNILHYDYIGYGLAKYTSPTEKLVYESAEAAYDYLVHNQNIKPEDIFVFGTSVGSGPSCHLATERPIGGLILECPFSSCVRVVSENKLGRLIDIFVNIDKISKVKNPVLLFHGKMDRVVPYMHSVQLEKEVPKDLLFHFVSVDTADHHNIMDELSVPTYMQYLLEFFAHCDKYNNKDK